MSLRNIVVGVAPGVRGVKGDPGAAGRAATFNWAFSTQTADADPGGGSVAFNNADLSLVTEIYFDDNETGGADVVAWLDLLTSTGNTDNRGELHFQATEDAGRFARFQVIGTVSSGATYRKISVTYITHAGAFAADDILAVALYRVGAGQAPSITIGDVGTIPPTSPADVTIEGTASAITLNFQIPRGFPGEPWSQWISAGWAPDVPYILNDTLENNGSSYICIVPHTSSAATEPGVGVDWETVWDLVAASGASGGVSGPASSTAGNIPTFGDASGAALDDSGVALGSLATTAQLGAIGQCELILDSTNLRLSRLNGRLITINGGAREIPSGGVALAATGLTVGTLYYIYAYMDSGTMTLEASATAPATHTDGTRIKTGDATRALVGMARPVTGPAWVDGVTQRFVRSWFNRSPIRMENGFTAQRSTSSTSLIELNTEIRSEFLIWEDEVLSASISSYANSASNFALAVPAVDTPSNISPTSPPAVFGSDGGCITATGIFALSTGYHYATFAARVSGGTGNYGSSALGFGSLNCLITPSGT